MAKIQDLMNLDFSEFDIKRAMPLMEAIRNLIADYNNEEDKEFFEKTAAENIDKLYELAMKHAPKSVKVKDKPSEKKADLRGFINGVIQKLTVIGEQHDGGDLEDIMFNTASDLQRALEEKNDLAMRKAAKEAVQPYLKWEKTVEHNQILRLGYVVLSEQEDRKRAAEIVDELLERLWEAKEAKKKMTGKESSNNRDTKKSDTKVNLTRALVKEVIDELTDLERDLKGESEIVIATTRMDLEEALDARDDQFDKQVLDAIEGFRDFLAEVRDDKAAVHAITSVNKLLVPLGQKAILLVSPKKAKEKSKKFMEELQEIEKDIEACRAVIREHNKKKRETEGPKPPKTRYMQLRERLLSIANLIPDKLKENVEVQQKTEAVLIHAHRELVKAWGMNKLKAKPGEKAIKEKFDAMEEKVEKEERKKIVEKWKKDLPEVDKVLTKVSKDKQTLKEAAIEVVNLLKQAIIYYEEDPSKAAKYLKAHFDEEQLEKHLPKYVRESLNL